MHLFLFWFGIVANSFTILAGLIAIAGVIWAFLGRARLEIEPRVSQSVASNLTIYITSVGSNPVRDLELNYGTLNADGFSMLGDLLAMRPTLSRGESLTVTGYESEQTSFGGDPREGEYRFEIQPGDGWFVTLQWRSPIFPWRRPSRTFAWPPVRRFASEEPEVLRGRRELQFFKRSRDPALNPTLPGFVSPAPTAIMATDESFDELVSAHRGPVVVAFGPTWQGQWWDDVKRMMEAFARKYAPRVRVLIVNSDESPALSSRFAVNTVPVFKVLRNGQVSASVAGVHSMPGLESELGGSLAR